MNFTTNIPKDSGGIFSTLPFKSSSSDSIYECRVYNDGSTTCNCPGWTRRVAPDGSRSCKHTENVKTKAIVTAAVVANNPGLPGGSSGYSPVQSVEPTQGRKVRRPGGVSAQSKDAVLPEEPKRKFNFDLT